MAVSHAVAMWLLRLTCGNREPVLEDVFKVVRTIDRGQGYDSLLGRRHRRRMTYLNRLGEIDEIAGVVCAVEDNVFDRNK